MAFDRRSFLKSVVASSLFSLAGRSLARAIATSHNQIESYLLLQGLFFLELDKTGLVVATPYHDKHVFYTRDHGTGSLIEMPRDPKYQDIDDGGGCSFPDQIPQFAPDDINRGHGFLKDVDNYRCKMSLPCPKEILALRQGPKAGFLPDKTKSNLAKKLKYSDNIATVICLVYPPAFGATPWTRSYYAEHASSPTTCAVNDALKSAQTLCGEGFDLVFSPSTPTPPPVDPDPDDSLPVGIDPTDEYNISEILHVTPVSTKHLQGGKRVQVNSGNKVPSDEKADCARLAGDVSSCPSFGIRP